MKREASLNFLVFIFICLSFISSAQTFDSITFRSKAPVDLSRFDDLSEFGKVSQLAVYVGLDIFDLRELDLKNDDFYTKFRTRLSLKSDSVITISDDTLRIYDSVEGIGELVKLQYPEDDKKFVSETSSKAIFSDRDKDTLVEWSQYFELLLPHKWDLRNYPFDSQKLRYVFESAVDTSILRLIPDSENISQVDRKKYLYLKDGYVISGHSIEVDYLKSQSTDLTRNVDYRQRLIFNVEINRKGSFLYFKLFLGGFLSFLISLLAFTIDSKYFETRITLNIGGIFGAVGNKYVVENTMPAVQVLTKADLVNNLIIVFIITNIFLVICQQIPRFSIGRFEQNKFAASFVLSVFLLINFLIVLF